MSFNLKLVKVTKTNFLKILITIIRIFYCFFPLVITKKLNKILHRIKQLLKKFLYKMKNKKNNL